MQTNNKSNSHKKVLEGVTTRHKQLNFVMKMLKLANTLEERRNRKKNKKKNKQTKTTNIVNKKQLVKGKQAHSHNILVNKLHSTATLVKYIS